MVKQCRQEGCINNACERGVCIRHVAVVNWKQCSCSSSSHKNKTRGGTRRSLNLSPSKAQQRENNAATSTRSAPKLPCREECATGMVHCWNDAAVRGATPAPAPTPTLTLLIVIVMQGQGGFCFVSELWCSHKGCTKSFKRGGVWCHGYGAKVKFCHKE